MELQGGQIELHHALEKAGKPTSATWVNKALKDFARVPLAPGEKKTVEITLPWEAFQIVDAEGRSIVEPGDFEVLVGPSSRDRDLLKATLRAQ
jgi:beta-glucosidase